MFWLLIPLPVVLPLWLFAGRALLGEPPGWMTVIIAFFIGPVLFIGLAFVVLMSLLSAKVREEARLSDYMAVAVAVLVLASIGLVIFTSDADDQAELGSVASGWFASLTDDRSDTLAGWSFTAGSTAFVVLIAGSVIDLVRHRRSSNA